MAAPWEEILLDGMLQTYVLSHAPKREQLLGLVAHYIAILSLSPTFMIEPVWTGRREQDYFSQCGNMHEYKI